MSVWNQPSETRHRIVGLVISEHHARCKKQTRLECVRSVRHNRARAVCPGRENVAQSIVNIAGWSLTEARGKGSVVSVGPEFCRVFPGSYQASIFFFLFPKSSLNLSIPAYQSAHSCVPALQAHCHRITESQNGRGWKGPLWVTQSNPPAEAGSPTAGCTGPCPGGS